MEIKERERSSCLAWSEREKRQALNFKIRLKVAVELSVDPYFGCNTGVYVVYIYQYWDVQLQGDSSAQSI